MTAPLPDARSASLRGRPPRGYARAAVIDVRQPYYNLRSDGVCEDLAVAPTAETRERLARCGFLWCGRSDGGDLLAPAALADAAGERTLDALLNGPPLIFVIEIARPTFAGVTDVPVGFGAGGASLCLSNRDSRRIAGGSAAAAVAAIAPAWERFVDLAAACDRARQLSREAAGEDGGAAPAGIAGWAGTAQAAPFLDEGARQVAGPRRRLPFAILAIHLTAPDERAADAVFPVSGRSIEPVRYRLGFEPLRTRWRYVVGMRGGAAEFDALEVSGGPDDPLSFVADEPALGPLPGAVATRAFVSPEPLALAQRPHRSFHLKGVRRGGRRAPATLIDPLPAPPPGAVLHRGAPGDAAAAVSEIYVYV